MHLEGYNLTDALAGKAPSPRKEFFYFGDDGNLTALLYQQYKIVFQEQRGEGFDGWHEQYSTLRVPKVYNLRSDPFEQRDGWKSQEIAMKLGVAWGGQIQDVLGAWFQSLQQYPPRQKSGSLNMSETAAPPK